MDADSSYSHNLYYALVNHHGIVLTDPMIFRTSQAGAPYIVTSYAGYGNTSHSWTAPSGVDGVSAFSASLFGGPPGESVAIGASYANRGVTTATGAILTATLAGGLTYVSDTLGVLASVSGRDVVWNLPDLDYLDSQRFTLYLQLPSGTGTAYGSRYPVTLTLDSDGPETNPDDNTDRAELMLAQHVFLPLFSRVY